MIRRRPQVVAGARANRAFLARVVRYLAGECGIRQFLDIGTGLPTPASTHQVAQAIAPGSRVVYVDNDPLVLVHARALLTSGPQGSCDYVEADVRDTSAVLAGAAQTLDLPGRWRCCCWRCCISCPALMTRPEPSPRWPSRWHPAASW